MGKFIQTQVQAIAEMLDRRQRAGDTATEHELSPFARLDRALNESRPIICGQPMAGCVETAFGQCSIDFDPFAVGQHEVAGSALRRLVAGLAQCLPAGVADFKAANPELGTLSAGQ